MAQGVEIVVSLDADGVKAGAKQATDAVDKLGDASDQAQEDADRAARLTAGQYRALASELRRYASDMGKPLTEAFEDIERASRDAGDVIDDQVLDALRKMADRGPSQVDKVKDAFKDLRREADDPIEIDIDVDKPAQAVGGLKDRIKDEGGESGREFAASFSGNASDVGDLGQEILANIGPAGIGAAVGLGFAISFITKYREEMQARKEEVNEVASGLFDVMQEEGVAAWGAVSAAAKQSFYEQQLVTIAHETSYSDVKKAADALGVGVADVYAAMAGDTESQIKLEDAHKGKLSEINDQFTGLGISIDSRREGVKTLSDQLDKSTEVVTKYTGTWKDGLNEAEGEASGVALALQGIKSRAADVADIGVNVSDKGTVKTTQEAIDEMRGREVGIDVTASGLRDIEDRIASLTSRPHAATIVVNERAGARATIGGLTR